MKVQKRKESFKMLGENIRAIRKQKGLSQEELAVKLNVVRQTVSKWENGLSVPDSQLLLLISEELDVPVSTLLGRAVEIEKNDELKTIAQKLEVINLQLARRSANIARAIFIALCALCIFIIAVFIIFVLLKSSYLGWDYSIAENAVLAVALHSLEWAFVRVAPSILIISFAAMAMVRKYMMKF